MNRTAETIHYPDERRDICFDLEEKSFWFTYRNYYILSILKHFRPDGKMLDVGGGNGFVSKFLNDSGIETILMEPGLKGCINAKERGVRDVVCSRAEAPAILPGSIGGIGLFDVLEHITDDACILKTLSSLLTDKGKIYITVPAYSWLWNMHDDMARHQRRYASKELEDLLKKNGYEVLYMSYFFSFLLPPVLLLRRLPYVFGMGKNKRISGTEDKKMHGVGLPAQIKKIIENLSFREIRKIPHGKIWFGTSLIAVARKR